MDRGYCLPSLLFDFFIPSGADILGTVKRTPMFPFTYDQKLGQNDIRQLVDKSGFKALFLKKLTIKEKQIMAMAYRDGKGGVTLRITASEQTRPWDLVSAKYSADEKDNCMKASRTKKNTRRCLQSTIL